MSEENVLPPFVYGKLRGHLTVKVDEILWAKNNPGSVFVDLLWWGEKESHIFRPECLNNRLRSCNEEDTSVTFNIRTSLQLFENYIKKSGKLVFGVFKYPSKEHLGDVTVWNPFKTIFNGKFEPGYYPIFNRNRLRIGDLRVSFELWMTKREIGETTSDNSERIPSNAALRNVISSSSSTGKDVDEMERDDALDDVVCRGKELRDAMTMSVLDDIHINQIDKVLTSELVQRADSTNNIDANKLMDFLMGKELPPEEEVLAIKTLRSLSPTQSVVNHELKSRITSSQSCRCCFKNNNSCSSCSSSCNASRPQTRSSVNLHHGSSTSQDIDSKTKSKHVIELVNCYKLLIQCLHLNSLGVKKVKGVSSKPDDKAKRRPGLYYMIEHLSGSQISVDKEKPWNLKQTRFLSRNINNNEIVFGESNFLIETINGNFSWPKILKQLNGTTLKIYWRYGNQRLPSYLGSAIIRDDSVSPSGLFSTFTLPVCSNSGITVGHLSLLLELGHNRRTFGNHLLSYDHFKENEKERIEKDDEQCECSDCRSGVDAIWGRDMECRARDMMVASHIHSCQSSRNQNPPTRTSSSKSNPRIISLSKPHSESRKSSREISSNNSSDEKVSSKKDDSSNSGIKTRLVDIPSNIPDVLKSSESSESSSMKSDSLKDDLQMESGNVRPRCITNDVSCQVTLDRSESAEKQDSASKRMCKSCLAIADHNPSFYTVNPNLAFYNTDAPDWSKRFPHQSSYIEPLSYTHYQPFTIRPNHSCHCCPSEFRHSHRCCCDTTSAQLNSVKEFYLQNNSHHRDYGSSLLLRDHHYTDSNVLHELSISIDKIQGFPMFNQHLNEEADCFVDYTFPANQNFKIVLPHRRYATEVCIISRDVSFSTVTKHSLMLPSNETLKHVFDSLAFHSVDFNVWCRLYRSTPVDHVIAKAILPIGRIYALKKEFDEFGGSKSTKDTVCLPLLTVASPLSIQYPTNISGSMQITLIYKHFSSDSSTLGRSTVNSNYSSVLRSNHYDRHREQSSYKPTDHCCNNINYNTIPRTVQKNAWKPNSSAKCESNQVARESQNTNREKQKEDRALSPIQEISLDSNHPNSQIENLRQSLERLVAEAEDINVDLGVNNNQNSDSSLEGCHRRNVIQLESSSDDGLQSIVPDMKPKRVKSNKSRDGANQPSLTEYQNSKKGDAQCGSSLSSNDILRDNFVINHSDGDTLKSVSSVNSDDSSSHVGFIAFNKDFVKNDCNMKKRKETVKSPVKNLSNLKSKLESSKDKYICSSKCTQTSDNARYEKQHAKTNVKNSIPLFKVKIEVERAINLPFLGPYSNIKKRKPSSYVSFDAYLNGNPEHITSEIVHNSNDPIWNASWTLMLPSEYLYKCDKKLVLSVMVLSHERSLTERDIAGEEEDRRCVTGSTLLPTSGPFFKNSSRTNGALRQEAIIDLTPLSAGLPILLGWYSLSNESAPCSGQIKVKITPLEDISKHKDVWFREYSKWEKNRITMKPRSNASTCSSLRPQSSSTSIPQHQFKTASVEPSIKASDNRTIDPIDKDLIYISLNQKLSELDKIPGYFKDKQSKSSECPQPSCSKSNISNEQETFKDLNIDKDISYVNKLLSEIPIFSTNNIRSNINERGSELCTKPLNYSTGLKRPQDFIDTSLNTSDIDLEEVRTNEKLAGLNKYDSKKFDQQDFNSNSNNQASNKYNSNDVIQLDKPKTDSRVINLVSDADQNLSSYQSFSPDLSTDNLTKSNSLNVANESLQPCIGTDGNSCIFRNNSVFPSTVLEQQDFMRFSPEHSKLSSAPVNPERYLRTEYFQENMTMANESEETENLSKDLATLSGQSSLCTDDQSNDCDQLTSQAAPYSPDYADNVNSDLMEEASSEIDRILRELNKQ